MTLCMAWREKDTICMASDSRLTYSKTISVDIGIKVIRVPLALKSGMRKIGDADDPPVTELGVCFAGDVASSMALIQALVEVLRNLKFLPDTTDIGMSGIAKYVCEAYGQIGRYMAKGGFATMPDLIVAGKCWQSNSLRAFRLSTRSAASGMLNEVLTDQDSCFIGSGAPKARELAQTDSMRGRYLHILKKVIDDDSVPDVGGNVQYGRFEAHAKNIFTIFPIAEKLTDGTIRFWRGGINLSDEKLYTSAGGLLLHGAASIFLDDY